MYLRPAQQADWSYFQLRNLHLGNWLNQSYFHFVLYLQVRTRLYELIAHCIPPEVIFVGIQKELVKVCWNIIGSFLIFLSRSVMANWRLNFAKWLHSTSTGCRRGTRPSTTWRPSWPNSWPSTWSSWRRPAADSRRRIKLPNCSNYWGIYALERIRFLKGIICITPTAWSYRQQQMWWSWTIGPMCCISPNMCCISPNITCPEFSPNNIGNMAIHSCNFRVNMTSNKQGISDNSGKISGFQQIYKDKWSIWIALRDYRQTGIGMGGQRVILLACGSFNPPTIMHLRFQNSLTFFLEWKILNCDENAWK